MEDRPRLRDDLEFFPVEQDKKEFVLVRDHIGLVKPRLIPIHIFQFMIQLNGRNSIRDLQIFLMKKAGGVIVSVDDVQNLLRQLDNMFLLDTERYRNEREKIEKDFSKKDIRPCSHCGIAYPDNPKELGLMIDNIIKNSGKGDDKTLAIIAPHIDISVGKNVYGDVYKEIKDCSYSRVVIIGVGHYMTENFFCLTEKDFKTPLGVVKTDKNAVNQLKRACPNLISKTDFAHKEEHSIEFQIIFLQHLLKGGFEIIPILCGPVQLFLNEYSRKAYIDKVRPFIEVLVSLFSEKKSLLVAGVDLSHIGPKFGHDKPASYIETQARKHDQALIEAIISMNIDAFWEVIAKDDRFNVCGFSAISCFLEILMRSSSGRILDYNACVVELLPKYIKSKLLNYHLWHEYNTNSAVSFCGIKFSG